MPELLVSTQPDLKQALSDCGLPAVARQTSRRKNGSAPPKPSESRPAGLSLAAILGSIWRGAIIVPILTAGLAALLFGLVPALFITLILLLVGLAPILLVGLGILLTNRIELPEDSLKRRGYSPK